MLYFSLSYESLISNLQIVKKFFGFSNNNFPIKESLFQLEIPNPNF